MAFSQAESYGQSRTIKGTVMDSLTKEILPYSNISIHNKKDSIVRYGYSNENAYFSITYNENQEGVIRFSHLGYKVKEFNLNEFPDAVNQYNFSLVQDANSIPEVVVKADSNIVIKKFDREVYNITEEKTKNVMDIYDILKTMPGVVVDESTKTIRFKGGSPEVLVDNMPSAYLYPKLEMISVEDIASVELIDRSALFGGSGQGGIINIKLKTKKPATFSAYISGDYSYTPKDKQLYKDETFLNLNYLLGPFLLFNNLSLNNTREKNHVDENGTINMEDESFIKNSKTGLSSENHDLTNYSGIYIPGETTKILIAYGFQDYAQEQSNTIDQSISGQLISFSNKFNSLNERNANSHYYLGKITQSFKNDREFSFTYTNARLSGHSDSKTNVNMSNDTAGLYADSIYNYSVVEKAKSSTTLYEFYYNHPFNHKWGLNIHGTHFSHNYPENSFQYLLNDEELLSFYRGAAKEQSNSKIGINISRKLKKLSLQGTIDYKYNKITGDFVRYVGTNDTSINVYKTYSSIIPSARITYSLNKINDFYLGYNYTNQPGDPEDYLSFVDKQNPINWYSGNNDLKPEYYHNAYFRHRFIKDSFNISTELFFKTTHNGISKVNFPIDQSTFLTMPYNLSTNQKIGADISLWYQINRLYKISFSTNIVHTYFESGDLQNLAGMLNNYSLNIIRKQFGYNSKLSFNYFNKKTIGMSFWFNYDSKEVTFSGWTHPYFHLHWAASKRFFNDKLFINFNIENVLYGLFDKKSTYDYMGVNTDLIYDYTYYKRYFRIYIYYMFKEGDRGSKDIKI
ncbi:MAG: hypothetical protein A2W91_13285 [Bacteroidetes bacterium GWF2_38_335]|nr:MAG: hypothetical protein A2W91_13285 [Bacteroidetes bacterium GWF2_38_335]OFY77228.1 MAG: hypothetical protein A2281_14950 [Bacteroidetes bacterium RIFOXYA12_FULL_38_20]